MNRLPISFLMCALFFLSFSLVLFSALCVLLSPFFWLTLAKIYWAARVYNVKMGAKVDRRSISFSFIHSASLFFDALILHGKIHSQSRIILPKQNLYYMLVFMFLCRNEYIRIFGVAFLDANPKNNIFTGISLGLNYSSVVQQLRVQCTYNHYSGWVCVLVPSLLAQNVKCIIIKAMIYVKCFIIRCINCELSLSLSLTHWRCVI